ncbi:response regulator [Sphingomonas sp. GB1N7]|uniref:response regulator n=1 Tax=Parasphingomonas caseinilytica TaxID=3096158 RepID=UPI002FCAC9D8
MLAHVSVAPVARIGIALVDGDASVRRDRQLMLGAENFDVRSYATCAAMIADPNARSITCLIVDMDMPEIGGIALLRKMRSAGWRGCGIVLRSSGSVDMTTGPEMPEDIVLPKTIADRPLLDAIRSILDQNEAHPFDA